MSYVKAFMIQKEREAKGLPPIENKSQMKEGLEQLANGLKQIKNSLPSSANGTATSGRVSTMGAQFHQTCKAMTSVPLASMDAEEAQRHFNFLTDGMRMLIAYANQYV